MRSDKINELNIDKFSDLRLNNWNHQIQLCVDSAAMLIDLVILEDEKKIPINDIRKKYRQVILMHLNTIANYTDSFNSEIENGNMNEKDYKLFFDKINLKKLQEKNKILKSQGIDLYLNHNIPK